VALPPTSIPTVIIWSFSLPETALQKKKSLLSFYTILACFFPDFYAYFLNFL